MSITHKVSEFDEVGTTFGLSAGGQQCFYCGDLLTDPAIMWQGASGQQIYLHGRCATFLVNGISRDIYELDRPYTA